MPNSSETAATVNVDEREQYDSWAGLIQMRLGRALRADEAARLGALVGERVALMLRRRALLLLFVRASAARRVVAQIVRAAAAANHANAALRVVEHDLGSRLSPTRIVAAFVDGEERRAS